MLGSSETGVMFADWAAVVSSETGSASAFSSFFGVDSAAANRAAISSGESCLLGSSETGVTFADWAAVVSLEIGWVCQVFCVSFLLAGSDTS